MQYYPKTMKGLLLNEAVAEQLGLLEEYQLYQEDYDYDPFN